MSTDLKRIQNDLYALGIREGDRVLVHSSYKSLGGVDGGIITFIDALKDMVGTGGTILFPTFTYDYVNLRNPVFDTAGTKCNVGAVPEVFRHTDGVKRSLHPTHSLAVWGRRRDEYIADHRRDNVEVGKNSPIYKLKDDGGKILMVGCGITHNTLIHGVEDYVRPPYVYKMDYTVSPYHREYACIDENDNVTRAEFFHEFIEPYGYEQDYGKLAEITEIKSGNVLAAESFIFDAARLWNTVEKKMRQEPYFFVKKAE